MGGGGEVQRGREKGSVLRMEDAGQTSPVGALSLTAPLAQPQTERSLNLCVLTGLGKPQNNSDHEGLTGELPTGQHFFTPHTAPG